MNELILLTRTEMERLAVYGVERVLRCIFATGKEKTNKPLNKDWGDHIEGVMREAALMCYYGEGSGWIPDNDAFMKRLDTKFGEVRGTHYEDGGLVIKKTDPDNRRMNLVVGHRGRYFVKGWIMSQEGKKIGKWKPEWRHPAWRVDPSQLNPISSSMQNSA